MKNTVKAWREKLIIPTYGVGTPEKNPIFLEKRVYQGSSGVVYPYPVTEKISDKKEDREWNAIYLENHYLKIMILPELGGRIQMAYDKIKQRHFVYYNQVIKPALVGLTGPWISGGIEFNWPQHHRPSTYEPLDSFIEENSDGSVTVWCSELERMSRTKGMAGFTLHPGKAYLEIKVKLFNRTAFPQSFLWWANPAVKVNDEYQSVFPPDVNAVFDHGKRDVSDFPIATGTYYKVDYSAGVDISKYKNIPVPTSYMAINSKYDFVGGYENDSRAGLLHIADHHVSPGKKQWTWGNGDFGQAWDRNLTDEDGPYIELMCGVYTDNQPDFTWLQAYEEKSFKQYFMPYREVGLVKNATKEAMLNLELENGKARIRVYATSVYQQATIRLRLKNKTIFERTTDLSPEMSFDETIPLTAKKDDCYLSVTDARENILVDWKAESEAEKNIPEPAKAAKLPHEIETTEQLYLTGLHLEQYRHATYNPTDYYREALRRDPQDIRNNNAMGLWLLRKGQFAKAEAHFRKAIATLTERNPNPYDGEALYNLGCCLRMQERNNEAYEQFYKATWNAAFQDSAYFNLAQLAAEKQDYSKALEFVNRSLWRNGLNQKARHLKVILLRITGQDKEALRLAEESLQMDPFNFGILYEKYLLTKNEAVANGLTRLMRDNAHNYIEFSLDYAAGGWYTEAEQFISQYTRGKANTYPMAMYCKAWYLQKAKRFEEAARDYKHAATLAPDYCFPNKLEELVILQQALKTNPSDARAYYYLGNFWYAARQYHEAVSCWEKSKTLNNRFPTVFRNLALAYYNKQNQPEAARKAMEKAFELDTTDARVLMELDQLYKKMNVSHEERLALLEKHPEQVESRDDLYLEQLSLYNLKGEEEKALELLMKRKFHPWEGGEGKVTGQYLYSHIEMAKKMMEQCRYADAIVHLKATEHYPYNLGEGKLCGALENDIRYWTANAYEALGDTELAVRYWEKASRGDAVPAAAMYYNDQSPDQIFYQGMALRKLNREQEAKTRFQNLLNYGLQNKDIPFVMDYFAVSLPDLLIFEEDLQKRHQLFCQYLIGLGQLGLGNLPEAEEAFNSVLAADSYHAGALLHRRFLHQ